MASEFGIEQTDVIGDRISETLFEQLTETGGVAEVTFDELLTLSEEEAKSEMGGMLTDEDNIALAKPQVIFIVVYNIHDHRAQNSDYTIPKSVEERYKRAIAWLRETGKALLVAEGTETPPDVGGIEYDVDDAEFGMDQTDPL